MKKLFIIFSLAIYSQYAHSQSIGIGANTTPDPSAVLDVNGTTKGFLPPRMNNVQRGAIGSPSVGLMVFQTNTSLSAPASSAGMYVNTASGWKRVATSDEIASGSTSWTVSGVNQYSNITGNVGIGVNPATEKLEVGGNIQLTTGSPFLKFQANTSPFFSSTIDFQNNLGNSLASIYQAAGLIGFSTVGHSGLLQLPPDGNIQMSNGATLYINSIGNSERTLRLNDETPTIEFNANGVEKGFLQSTGDDMIMATSSTNLAGELKFRIKNSQKAIIDINGNMGVGVVAPTEKLHVGGNAIFNAVDPTISLSVATVNKGFVQLNGEDLRIGTYSGNNIGHFVVRTNGADHLEVDENGNTIMKKLLVNKDFEAVKISGNDPAINFFESGIQRGYIWMINNDMNIGNSQANSRINMSTSQVTIGTSIATPGTYKLGVGGRIICEELKVKLQSNGWPDYVFGENYKLKSLEEVENFIKINNHLPNIPSAQVIDKEGLEVGEMQRRMMEKIEELTLYIIDLKKEVNTLKANTK